MKETHRVVETTLMAKCEHARVAAEHGKLASFIERDFVLVAPEDFHSVAKLCLPWRGIHRITKSH